MKKAAILCGTEHKLKKYSAKSAMSSEHSFAVQYRKVSRMHLSNLDCFAVVCTELRIRSIIFCEKGRVKMDINETMAKEIAAQLGLGKQGAVNDSLLKSLERKTDEELAKDILKMKSQLAAANISPARQQAMLRSLMPMMNGSQRARLEKIIRLISG